MFLHKISDFVMISANRRVENARQVRDFLTGVSDVSDMSDMSDVSDVSNMSDVSDVSNMSYMSGATA